MAEKQMIFEAISQTMKDVGIVKKGDYNTFDKYKFRGIDAVMNALNPAMTKNGIFVIPEVLEHNQEERQSRKGDLMIYTTCKVRYTFYAADGSNVQAVVVGEAMDRSDKSTNKAMSAAFKYACFQTFCIPTEEMIDSEVETPEPAPRQAPKTAQKGRQAQQKGKPQEQPQPPAPEPQGDPNRVVGEPAYPPVEQMVEDIKARAEGNAVLTEFIKKALAQTGCRTIEELSFANENAIKAWWGKLCQGSK